MNVKPTVAVVPPASSRPPTKPKTRGFTDLLGALASVGAQRDWLFTGAIEGSPLVVWAGPEKRDKSWTMIAAAVAAATGGAWLGFAAARPGPVIYLDGEYGEHEFARRFARVCRGAGQDPARVAPRVRHYYSRDLVLEQENDAMRWLWKEAKALKPVLVIVDPWRNHLPGDENSAPDTLDGLNVCAGLRDMTGAALFIAHHLNKSGVQSGSRALMTRADLLVEGTDDDEPTYSARGRTLRRKDPITHPFRIVVEHDDDEDDTVAKTRVGVRFEGETTAVNTQSKTALRIREALSNAMVPLGHNAIKAATKITSGRALAKAFRELQSARIIKREDDGRWSLETGEFFAALGKEAGLGEEPF